MGKVINLLILSFAVGLLFIGFQIGQKLTQKADLTMPIFKAMSIIEPTPPPKPTLGDTLSPQIDKYDGTYGVYVKNLKTGEVYEYNSHKTFQTASLYKLWIMGETYDQVAQGSLSEDQVLSETVESLNNKFDIDPAYAELTEGTVTHSVSEALNEMITVSDNYSALLLSSEIGLSNVTSYLKTNGLTESAVGEPPQSTPADIGKFFEKLYHGQLAGSVYTQRMISLLKQQQLNEKIPLNLSNNVTIAHKTGELGSVSHDAGIVYSQGGDYIIVVMTDTTDPKSANNNIADISKTVYGYFN